MSVWEWSVPPEELIARLQAKRARFRERAVEVLEEVVAHGAGVQLDSLEGPESFTRTGEERVATGRGLFAGRHLTGALVGAVEHRVEVVEDTSDQLTVVGRWGWRHPEDYYLDQEYGPDGPDHDQLPAAHSLAKSFAIINRVFQAQVEAMGQ